MQTNLIGIILLAAGASRRLGTAKQLLEFQNQTLLRRSAEIALQVSGKVVVTLGAQSEMLRKEIVDLSVEIVENKDWEAGMGGSVKIGLEKLLATNRDLRGVIIMVCDQPFVNGDLLKKIVAKYEATNSPIVASQYENTLGVPALFSAKLFAELLALEHFQGAKQLIKKHLTETVSVSFPGGAFDIDTPRDYENLLKKFY
ncbi:MAG: nucleotidyltransferase family protein [Pyrinomonadaceae bacterium]|nr:nucleotidyltransferase family protein [Pyrinomonadaceae bacterium]